MAHTMDPGFQESEIVKVKETLGDFEQSLVSDIIYEAYIRGDTRSKTELIQDYWRSRLS
jgi:polyribonucleotide nucleotidyltransferase